MNKYVLRTSLVWIVVLAAIAGIWAYRTHAIKQPTAMTTPMSGDVPPVASGPPPGANEPTPSMPEDEHGYSARSRPTHTRADAEYWRKNGHCRVQATERRHTRNRHGRHQ